MSTNGVQPLWMILQIILVKVFPNVDSVILLSRSSWICYVVFSFLVIRYISRNLPPKSMFFATMTISALTVLNIRFQKLVLKGLETPLMLLVLVLTLYFIDHTAKNITAKPTDNKVIYKILSLAIIATLTFFARTDLFWVSVVIGIWLIVVRKPLFKEIIAYSIAILAIVSPYLIFNYMTQNSLMPISGRIKLFYLSSFYPDWISYLASDEWQGLFSAFTYTLIPIKSHATLSTLLVITTGFTILWLYWNSDVFPTSMKLLSMITISHIFFLQFVYRELRPYTSYYFAPEVLWFALIIAFYVAYWANSKEKEILANKRLLTLGKTYGYIAITFICISISTAFWIKGHKITPSPYWIERLNLAYDIQKLVPENEPIGAFWPGTFAQFSGRTVIPLDGVIGSNEYFQNYVKTGRELNFLVENSVEYIAIYLNEFSDGRFTETKPTIGNWAQIGTERLWEQRNFLQVVASRPLNSKGTGWYLFKLNIQDDTKK